MDFVFMLTRNDATVGDALDLVAVARPLGLRHIGFKDVGAEPAFLARLATAIREAGAQVWMEVVAVPPDDQRRAFTLARDIGVDWLMGGACPADALRTLQGGKARHLPFAGRPEGHPTRLGGQAAEIEAQCRDLAAMGCAGVDILAYRATEAEPLDLIAACRRGLPDGAQSCRRRLDRFGRTDRRDSRCGGGRFHHWHSGHRWRLRPGRWAARSAASRGACGLRAGGLIAVTPPNMAYLVCHPSDSVYKRRFVRDEGKARWPRQEARAKPRHITP